MPTHCFWPPLFLIRSKLLILLWYVISFIFSLATLRASLCLCLSFFFLFFLFFFFLATWHVGSYFPDQGSNLCPLHSKHGVLTTGQPGKFLCLFFFKFLLEYSCFTRSLCLCCSTPYLHVSRHESLYVYTILIQLSFLDV